MLVMNMRQIIHDFNLMFPQFSLDAFQEIKICQHHQVNPKRKFQTKEFSKRLPVSIAASMHMKDFEKKTYLRSVLMAT